jgi:hypothetical protein
MFELQNMQGANLLHDAAYYTLSQLPAQPRSHSQTKPLK